MDATLAAAAVTTKPWAAHDTRLTLVTVIGIAIIVALIVVLKMHPFLSLMAGSAFVGLAAGVALPKIISNFETGVGSTLQEVGLLIALGAMLGKLLADSGGADQVIDKLFVQGIQGDGSVGDGPGRRGQLPSAVSELSTHRRIGRVCRHPQAAQHWPRIRAGIHRAVIGLSDPT
jgi:hypothetical protein